MAVSIDWLGPASSFKDLMRSKVTGWGQSDESCSGAVVTGSISVFLAVSVILLLLYVVLFHFICFFGLSSSAA